MTRAGFVLLGLGLCLQDPAFAQGTGEDAAKRLCLKRVDAPPIIDGVVNDDEWAGAIRIDDLHQFRPIDHGTPTEDTEFFVAYDDDNFYVGARLFDSEPERILARQLVQGQTLQFDDAMEFILDPFANRRSGYLFQLNPNGLRRDGLYESPTEVNRDWDGIWRVEARTDDNGWTAEVAVPFKTLNFNPGNPSWGFTIARTIARKKEEIAWASFDRSINPGSAGTLDCISGLEQGRGLDIAVP